ncbi:MAG: 4-hydroxy-3-methylbut-2-enyl diphosphate reductase [Lentisphaerae bacterium]|nr:4-hydroxy-3-methylbut-2-enyl diphosphate reductase [Lentisphaerota bacterium]
MGVKKQVGRTVVTAFPHGFCAGVERAVQTAEAALKRFQPPIYGFKAIVHNRQVVEALTAKGIVFVKKIKDVPKGGTVLFSAHGVAPAVRTAAGARRLKIIDATCPFVSKVHAEVRRYAAGGYAIALIGHRGHDEVIGVVGESPERVVVLENESEAENFQAADPAKVAVLTQTTLSEDETERVLKVLKRRFPGLVTPARSDICYATTNRQQAVKALAKTCECVLVLGSASSSNSNRLVEVAESAGCPAKLVSDLDSLEQLPDLKTMQALGLTAGASTPEPLVEAALAVLRRRGFRRVRKLRVAKEDLHFSLPAEVREEKRF